MSRVRTTFLVGIFLTQYSVSAYLFAQKSSIPICGQANTVAAAPRKDGADRPCDHNGQRHYQARHKGIGFEILTSESKACFVPDQEFQLLDQLIDKVLAKVKYDPLSPDPRDQAIAISKTISQVLDKEGFALYIDTETLGDALLNRNSATESPRRIFDCDTGSLIFLTIAENLGAPVAMVEMPLGSSSKNHHNFVRWLAKDKTLLEWDMNMATECRVPDGLTGVEGRSLSREETLAYALLLRSILWKREKAYDHALADMNTAMVEYEGSDVYNNLAWLIDTEEIPNREILIDEAVAAAQRAVEILPSANYKDTLACAYALRNEFSSAIKLENEALKDDPWDSGYEHRLKLFQQHPPKNCTGE